MRPLRIAVVGAGHLGRIHARRVTEIPELQLVGIVDPIESLRSQTAAEFGTEAFAQHDELLGKIDAAVVATPTQYHHGVALDLLSRGVHVLVEKPLCATRDDADELVKASRMYRAVLQVGHSERFNPAWAAVLPHVREPKIIQAARYGTFTCRSTDIGAVLDLMIHDLDLVLSLVQSPLESVEATGVSLLGRHEDVAHARLTFASGCVATLSASRVSHAQERRMQIWSARAMAQLDFATRNVTLTRISEPLLRRELDVEKLSASERGRLKDRLLVDYLPQETMTPEPIDAIAAELRDFAESILQGRSPRVTGEQACEAVAVAEEITHQIAAPPRSVIPAPHWNLAPSRARAEQHREAG